MKLKIDFTIPAHQIGGKWPSFFTIGSCFADSQARRMRSLGMEVYSNPYGIVYNPISIERIFVRSLTPKRYTTQDFEQRESIFSWEHHGDFKYQNTADAVAESNAILTETVAQLAHAEVIIITYGTSLVYTHDKNIVANCHKVPNREFEQKQLRFLEVKESIQQTLRHISTLNPTAQVVFTVSPVRHLRSGVSESSRSKAILIGALHEVLDEAQNNHYSYFPSYEIFMDELRDYRFAKTDMTHPTEQAEEYIWDRFCETYFSKETLQIVEDVKKYNQLAAHRPIHSAELHNMHVSEKLKTLQKNYPFLNFK